MPDHHHYHIYCTRPVPTRPTTSFQTAKTSQYTRSYFKSTSLATRNLYLGEGNTQVHKLVNHNFRIPTAK